ncbi:glycoside hydrolase family 55 protein [Sphingomonas aurantiaca]|uniref:glycoside hydrolase family 55 protein n=1 Tax=Sphingomonas aurantiaca TaxID=185949 RepID=UPI001F2A2335|nr:glycoside hydrolase family 55 protein [Sphingomonas aurantiaca]
MTMKWLLGGAALLPLLSPVAAFAKTSSVYLTRPDDPRAVTVKGVGDGRADDSVALQQAIDSAAAGGQGTACTAASPAKTSRSPTETKAHTPLVSLHASIMPKSHGSSRCPVAWDCRSG